MDYSVERERMLRDQLMARGIDDPRVLDAMAAVPRECFVPEESHGLAYDDHPIPIGYGQTISQPYIVALMTQLLRLPDRATVLEIGSGGGYQTAILAHIADRVCAIERDPRLAERARETLDGLGFGHFEIHVGDGFDGWPDESAQFDGILIACAPDHLPEKPAAALKPGARMIVPIGPEGGMQELNIVTRQSDGRLKTEVHSHVRFVPMV
ncbi:L-isoaspartate O-methyl transferase [Haloferula helveola]|uniref:Protein-L-isoaspartate O-methyltransferase n=1 Tax=Haloferula helveola TaxID=490095 RepID=A0ABM7R772_9BACT|nr:L-isoaspartate O-methyl transferase [Haloferula helveola]